MMLDFTESWQLVVAMTVAVAMLVIPAVLLDIPLKKDDVSMLH